MSKKAAPSMESELTFNDPAVYRKLCEPRPIAEVEKSVEAFFRELYVLRVKHGIQDVLVGIQVSTIGETGREGRVTTSIHLGDSVQAEPMSAWLYGYHQCRRQETIAHTVKTAGSAIGKPADRL